MPTPTYTPLANITLTGTASSVTFSGISQGFRDLILVTNLLNDTGANECNIIFNGSSANLPWVRMIGYSSGTLSSSASNPYPLVATNTQQVIKVQIMDYSATDKHKTFLYRKDDVGNSRVDAYAGRWESTSAVTSIQVSPVSSSFVAGFTAALYGVAA